MRKPGVSSMPPVPVRAVVQRHPAGGIPPVHWAHEPLARVVQRAAARPVAEKNAWKTGLDRQKQKGDGPEGVDLKRRAPRKRGGQFKGALGDPMVDLAKAVGAEKAAKLGAHWGHQVPRALGGKDAARNLAVTTDVQEAYQGIVEDELTAAIDGGHLHINNVTVKHTAYLFPGTPVAKVFRIKVGIYDPSSMEMAKMIDIAIAHDRASGPDHAFRQHVRRIVRRQASIHEWLIIHG